MAGSQAEDKESAITSFPLFPALPQEIHQMIWQETIHARIIPVDPSKWCGAHSLPLQTIRSRRRRPTKCSGCFTICDVDPIVALNVSKESRSTALRYGGYRAWKIANIDGGTKDLMWSPALDVVTVIQPHEVMRRPCVYSYVFRMLFRAQAKELQRFAVPTSTWPFSQENHNQLEIRWLAYPNLKELVVILEERYERICIERICTGSAREGRKPWVIPMDIQVRLESLGSIPRRTIWIPPSVRVVRAYDGILAGHSEKWRLRARRDPNEQELMQLDL